MEISKDLKFNDDGLIPVVSQDIYSNEILMVAYANKEAIEKTLQTKKAHYYSRSRQKLWMKGETSGNTQAVRQILIDCDEDTLIYKIVQKGPACHTGKHSCFYRELKEDGISDYTPEYEDSSKILKQVYNVVKDRQENPKEGSYTNYLLDKGIDKILKKVGEESAETIIAAKNNKKDEIELETADLFYHIVVMLVDRGLTLEDIYKTLIDRR